MTDAMVFHTLHPRQAGPSYVPSWQYWWGKLSDRIGLTPLRIATVYLIFGLIALYFSDVLLVRWFDDPLLQHLQALKGSVEVFLTAGLIFVLAKGREAQLQQGLEQLDQQRTELQVLHRVLRHNLRNDLNIIQGHAEQIERNANSDAVTTNAQKILAAVRKLTRHTEQANRIKKITEYDEHDQPFELTESIPRLVETHPKVTSEVQVTTRLPPRATIEANPMFESALKELLTNAIVHNDKDEPRLEIRVDAVRGAPHMVEIQISDNGPGIPEIEREPLLEGEEESLFHLSGLGLWFVKWTVRHSQGEMEIEKVDSEGTIVTLRIPMTSEMFVSTL